MKVGNQLTVTVRLDLAQVQTGTYWLGTRLSSGDQIYYYPLRVQQFIAANEGTQLRRLVVR